MLDVFRRIGFKLAILAGAPLIGALILSAEIAREDRARGESAAAIGSFEDLAELSTRMNATVNELQGERSHAALALGFAAAPKERERSERANQTLIEQEHKTDVALSAMDAFLANRDLKRLPLALSEDLANARHSIAGLDAIRRRVGSKEASLDDVLTYYGSVCDELTDATAALARLSDDGELLRALSSLVATMRLKESEAEQHALLAHVFATQEYAPGIYRELVNLVTEEELYADSLKSFATRDQFLAYRATRELPAAKRSDAMRAKALATVDDDFGIDAEAWFDDQEKVTDRLEQFEEDLAHEARSVARRKVEATQVALHYNEALVAAVVLLSALLTAAVGRGISRSVSSLAKVTGRIQEDQDFSVRAVKTSQDELGALTDAFNAMLQGIEDRDTELMSHRENLERLVLQRTAELSKRNEDMRFVLDTVEQGLVTIDKQGVMSTERSRAFDKFFGVPPSGARFFSHIGASNAELAAILEIDWTQITDGILPLELTLSQAKNRFQIGATHYALHYNPLLSGEDVTGALLTISDVTSDVAARQAEAAQAEQAKTFTRLMKDRSGFIEFFREAQAMVARIRNDGFVSASERLRTVHTLKGNAALFDVSSVANAAHGLEDALVEGTRGTIEKALAQLTAAWESFGERVLPLFGDERNERLELSREEIAELLAAMRGHGLDAAADRLIAVLHAAPVSRRFERLGQQLRVLSTNLGKAEVELTTSGGEIRLPDERLAPVWSAFAHVVRNVADHGLETSEARSAAGKPPQNRVSFAARVQADELTLSVSDDGRGVDWSAVAERARALGLPHATPAELAEALFAPTLSTAQSISHTSGRGVGMGAVRQVCRDLGGDCTIESTSGRGTTLTCRVALNASYVELRASAVMTKAEAIPSRTAALPATGRFAAKD